MPGRWSAGGLHDFVGRVRFVRRFGYPGRIDDYERVWLTFAGADHQAAVWLNGTELGRHNGALEPFEFEVTRLLLARNELVIEVEADHPDGGLWGEVAMEVRATAFLHGVEIQAISEGEIVHIRTTGRVLGTSPNPLELYLLLGRSTVGYLPIAAGSSFELISDPLRKDTLAGIHAVRVELVNTSTVWYVVELEMSL